MAKSGKTGSYKGALAGGGTIAVALNMVTRTVSFTISKVDLSGVASHTSLYFDIVGSLSGRWSFDLYLQQNKAGTVFKY
jgi:hypothetical protein